MFQDIFPHVYRNEMSFAEPSPDDYALCITKDGIRAALDLDRIILPRVSDFDAASRFLYLFRISDSAFYLLTEGKLTAQEAFPILPHAKVRDCAADEMLFACAVSQSLWHWYSLNRFCGRCAKPMEPSKTERALVCPECRNTVYPKICPAVIVAVTDGERLLLTRYKNRPFKKYALIAGFAEIGESIEDTVRREVKEETGVSVKNLRFYKSQPWVFTDTLLMGFYCDLDGSDTITVQEDELAEAGWFRRSELPEDHSHISLTGEMIENFRTGKC